MKLIALIKNHRQELAENALRSLCSARLRPYDLNSPEENRNRFLTLIDLLIHSLEIRSQEPMRAYARMIAHHRYESGYGLHDVFTAFNVLEEQAWHCLLDQIDADELGRSLALLATVIGAGKESLSLAYVEFASQRHAPCIDTQELLCTL
jgi:hypothetical protein